MSARHRTRWIALGAAVVLVAFGVVLAVQHRSEASVPRLVQEHKAVPKFSLETLAGKRVSSGSLAGKTYVVNFWNSWCIPCRQEAPALESFYAAHRSEPDFAMVGIVRDDDPGPIRDYVAAKSIAWPVAFDPNGSAGLGFGTTGQPETYVISRGGVAACGTLGPVTRAELEAWLQAARAGGTCA
ncbi:MAG: cytochrome c biosis protein CcmG, thiol:disulfide interchange protein DsbE [Actinomycetota bacterium]|nr:cytochrome c biosis protein CcmG, thiol:disulfide interchange protein DsbE [Actinomycetota bacterium]